MNELIREKAKEFKYINDIAEKGEIVVFGSSRMADFPFCELVNRYRFENAVYNRSIHCLTIDDAAELLEVCVTDIRPRKVFLSLGEVEAADASFDSDILAKKYAGLIHRLKLCLPDAEVYVIGLFGDGRRTFNGILKQICRSEKAVYIEPLSNAASVEKQYVSLFKQLARYFRNTRIGMADAFAVSEV
nr:hypothetical protein [Clostridia bacterium]